MTASLYSAIPVRISKSSPTDDSPEHLSEIKIP